LSVFAMERQIDLPFGRDCFPDRETFGWHATILGGFCLGLGLPEWADHSLPGPGSGAGYKASEYLLPLVLMLVGGGRSLEDIRFIRDNRRLRTTLKLKRIPSPDAIGDWLRRIRSRGGLKGLARINRALLERSLAHENQNGLTLDICAMRIAAEKAAAKPMPDGTKGYQPLIGFLKEKRLVIGDLFREGDAAPTEGLLELGQNCIRQIPETCQLKRLRAVGPAVWPVDLKPFTRHPSIDFIIGIDADKTLLDTVQSLPESNWRPYRAGRLAKLAPGINIAGKPCFVVVWRRSYQADLFGHGGVGERFLLVATTATNDTRSIMGQYRDHIENSADSVLRLQNGFALERMPCGQTDANAVFFRIGTIAHNVYQLYSTRIEPDAY
jgi:hypothetical protein